MLPSAKMKRIIAALCAHKEYPNKISHVLNSDAGRGEAAEADHGVLRLLRLPFFRALENLQNAIRDLRSNRSPEASTLICRNETRWMKRFVTILLGALLFAGGLASVTVTNAAQLVIAVGDRSYYTRGPYYIENGVRREWVAGHWGLRHHHRVWVHGHYARR